MWFLDSSGQHHRLILNGSVFLLSKAIAVEQPNSIKHVIQVYLGDTVGKNAKCYYA